MKFNSFLMAIFSIQFCIAGNLISENPKSWCRELDSDKIYRLGTLSESSPFYVDSDSEYPNKMVSNCPNLSKNCINKYLNQNKKSNKLIVGKFYNNMFCSYNLSTLETGWLPASIIKFSPMNQNNINTLNGTWQSDTSKITFKKAKNKYIVSGEAKWYGGSNGENINYGNFSSNIFFKDIIEGTGLIKNDDCLIKFNLIDNTYLILHDNNQCGGMNVRFNSIYQKGEKNWLLGGTGL